MKKFFKPFEPVKGAGRTTLLISWLLILAIMWTLNSLFGSTHMFPTPKQVGNGFINLWNEGLVVHIGSSVWLCTQAVFMSVLISLTLAYATAIPFFKPVGTVISKLRYLPLTGIAFYISIAVQDARAIQVWVLVVFMTTFLVTSLIQMVLNIDDEEFYHARTLGCSRWETLWEVVIKGRIDHVLELIRQNLAIVWMMLVTVESILVAAGGLGFLIKNNDRLGDNGRVIALQAIIVLVGISLDFIITKIRKITFRYSKF